MTVSRGRVGVLVGNPKADSRTLASARLLARLLVGRDPDIAIDAVLLGAGLLQFGDPGVASSQDEIGSCELVVVASPTYKGSLSGVLKCFLDLMPAGALAGVVAVPLMLGAGPRHALAPELTLKPVLVELGATCPTAGIYVAEERHDEPDAYDDWLETWRPVMGALVPGARD